MSMSRSCDAVHAHVRSYRTKHGNTRKYVHMYHNPQPSNRVNAMHPSLKYAKKRKT